MNNQIISVYENQAMEPKLFLLIHRLFEKLTAGLSKPYCFGIQVRQKV